MIQKRNIKSLPVDTQLSDGDKILVVSSETGQAGLLDAVQFRGGAGRGIERMEVLSSTADVLTIRAIMTDGGVETFDIALPQRDLIKNVRTEGGVTHTTVIFEFESGTVQQVKVANGERGERGEVGPRGLQGEVGPRGLQGPQGERGQKGDKGDIGPQGVPGPRGERGERGVKGDVGERGPQGPQGLRGERGLPGPAGPAGSGTGDMLKANNLSDLTNKVTARNNLQVYSKQEVDSRVANAGTGDMLKSVYDSDNDGKVDTAKVADSAIVAQTAQSVDWQVIRGKPSTFPASSHTHSVAEVNGLQAVLDGKAPTNHTHTVTQITGLQNALDGKMGRFVEVRVETAWNVVAKVGTTTAGNYRPQRGDVLLVTFVNGTDVSRPTLNIDGSGAKNIRAGYYDVGNNMLRLERRANSNVPTLLWYDGEYYQMFGAGHNYSYGEIPEAEISNANATPSRAITGRRIAKMKEYFEQNVPNPTANTHAVNKGYMDGRMQGLVTSAQLTQGLQDKAGLNEENLFTKKQKFSDSNDDVVDYYVKIDGNVPCVEMGGGDYEKVTYGVNEEGIVMSVNDTNVLASDDRSISLIQDNIYWSPVVSNIGSVTYPKIQVLNNEDAYTSLGVKDPNTFYFIKQ